ncbi:bifunctional purine biosynthesis protein PurH [Philodulcilactobacillus myokoensis]|uniref:Bifunctional purine biosynthesis protein PurH n=1 Tax=Philodulcilactobacillus myokoensis TaxID=2929573 RepID=A0A9W6B2L1_9LACO|nr:bifunctional phosphoribosylaminoimidazolecarboxamide formyltransferase/IMP cyclohydrolase [Philodulcilactobacillus myokoensis]GLB47463.1 bifunctional purine biosynthesis protein PurH [Philodulcilactobacillus myokoensis]
MTKLAVLSVSDKRGISDFAKQLIQRDFKIVSTGGTFEELKKNGVDATPVEDITHFKEMLDGRVKTLHPNVFGGILAKRDNPKHMKQLKENHISTIDLVCVNLYPFKATIQKPNVSEDDALENIDIGGPSMLRAAAKNYHDVFVITDPSDYKDFIEHYDQKDTGDTYRHHLAAKVFQTTAAYDALISKYLSNDPFPDKLTLTYEKADVMRYGENSHQKAAYYKEPIPETFSLANAKKLHGKKISYNNMCDADAALRIISEYKEPAVVAVKHRSPCGIGTDDTLYKAWRRAYESDTMSIFGGIVAFNRTVDLDVAKDLHKIFLEIVIAPKFSDDAYKLLAEKKNIRLMTVEDFTGIDPHHMDEVSLLGGILRQTPDLTYEAPSTFKIVTKAQPTDEQMKAMAFGQHAVKNVKSNAVVVTTGNETLGIGAGQPNRIDSAKIAIHKAINKPDYNHAVMASDAFFPMDDCVKYAATHDIKAIVEPGGSIRDKDSIKMADHYGIVLAFTGVRHFKH